MSPGENPYWHRGPIRDPAYFYGRAREVRNALSLLRHLQCVSLVAPRRVGKTSVLHYISHASVLEQHHIDPGQYAFVLIDCQGSGDLGRAGFYRLMLKEAQESIARLGRQIELADLPAQGEITFASFESRLRAITQGGLKLIFLFDEFEGMSHNNNLDSGFFTGLRSLVGEDSVAYVTASRRSLFDLTYARGVDVLTSPFFNIFSTIDMELLEEGEAQTLINEPSRQAGIAFSEGTVEYIQTLADHHPLYLQIACFHAFEAQSEKGALGPDDYPLLRHRVEPELIGHLKYAWKQLTERERQVLLSLETAQRDPRHHEQMQSLKNQGVICRRDDQYILLCAPWVDFVASQAPEELGPEPEEEPLAAPRPPVPEDLCAVSVHLFGPGQDIVVGIEGAINYLERAGQRWEANEDRVLRYNRDVDRLCQSDGWKYDAKGIGQDLHRQLVDTQSQVSRALSVSVGRVRRPKNLHISFKVERKLLRLPLELICDDEDWLALKHPLSKYITGLPFMRRPFSPSLWRDRELRVLLVASNVSGTITVSGQEGWLSPIPGADAELEELRAFFEGLAGDGPMGLQLTVLGTDEATYERVSEELQSGQHHLFHYCGHGFFDAVRPEKSCLFFWDAGPGSAKRQMTASELKLLIQDSDLRFAYFSCCEGAAQAGAAELLDNDFLGIVDASLEAGLPAVLGMRWPLNDESALVLARAFYEALFPAGALDTALLRARQAIARRDREDITWVSPILVVQG